MKKIFEMLFVKELCFQSEGEVCFKPILLGNDMRHPVILGAEGGGLER